MAERVVVLLDGGFVKKKLEETSRHFPTVAEIVALCGGILAKPSLAGKDLFRIYYYDAPPFEGSVRHPLTRLNVNYSNTPVANQNKSLIDSLELQPDFAVRRGTLKCSGWKLGRTALRRLSRIAPVAAPGAVVAPPVPQQGVALAAVAVAAPAPNLAVTPTDFVPNMQQKGVDMRIGLDMAWIALKRLAEILVLVTGDSDFVPVMKFARKEGMRVFLECMNHPVSRDLKAHADRVL
ncbi:MAG TPA: NYN domain-containing protein [Terriglobales bacterium]|nr:NYN domain-containing protein [Terriglobales bacterium]